MTEAELERCLDLLKADVAQFDGFIGGLLDSLIRLGANLNSVWSHYSPAVVSERFDLDSELVMPTRKLADLYARFPERLDLSLVGDFPLRHAAAFLSHPGVLPVAEAATGYTSDDLTGFIRRSSK